MITRLIASLHWLYLARNSGAAMVEFAITAPFMVVLALGVADYGALMNASASLEGATRAVAEYVRDAPECALTGLTSSTCFTGINGLVSTLQSNNTSLASATFTVPLVGNVPLSTKNLLTTSGNYCTCTDGTAVSCSTGTCNVSGDTRVLQYIQILAKQSINPLVSYGTYTSAQPLNANTTTRIQ